MRLERTARRHDTAAARKVAGEDEAPSYFHGTARPLRDSIRPADQHGRGVTFPHDTSTGHAYATTNEHDAWHYAEMAWNNTDDVGSGPPRVYEVRPTGDVERDPQFDEHGRSRSNFAGDVRSPHPFKIVRQVPMPEHMGTPRDWR